MNGESPVRKTWKMFLKVYTALNENLRSEFMRIRAQSVTLSNDLAFLVPSLLLFILFVKMLNLLLN